jgi:16S rRNA (guanine527-N7)-methyltransferase
VSGGDAALWAALDDLGAAHDLSSAQVADLASYVTLVLSWGRANLTGLRDPAKVARSLIGDSLALLAVAELRSVDTDGWLDLGSGAGIPGIPLAVAVPEARVTLLEASTRKCEFLRHAVKHLGLDDRVQVVRARSEHHAARGAAGREAYGAVLARALAALPVLIELAAPLLAGRGVLLASVTSRSLEGKLAAAESAAARCGMSLEAAVPLAASPLDDSVCVVVRNVTPPPEWLPRREGMAVKRPLGG